MSLLNFVFDNTNTRDIVGAAQVLAANFRSTVSGKVQLQELVSRARSRGIVTRFVSDANFEGMFSFHDGMPVITLRHEKNERRLLFTLAHEIGHFLITLLADAKGAVKFRRRDAGHVNEEEILADAIAAEILMPVIDFRSFMGNEISFASIERAQRHFGASKTATMRRVADVLHRRIALLNVVPTQLWDPTSPCLTDEAMFVIPNEPTRAWREEVGIISPPRFASLRSGGRIALRVQVPDGLIRGDFEIKTWSRPCPNADLLFAA